MSELRETLNKIREQATSETEAGIAFEKLTKVFLENDATQTQEFSQVWLYRDWVKENSGYITQDVGIDLVAKLRNEDGFCAVQCKFYDTKHYISKADLDSFISASSTADFNRLLLIDTSLQPFSKNAQTVLDNLDRDFNRIQLIELEESLIDWPSYIQDETVRLRSKKNLFDHQVKALNAVCEGLNDSDRGKLIMACGTGKTFTSLRIAEKIAGVGKLVLYMVPSLALMSQVIREWKNDSMDEITAFSVCSDAKVGKKKEPEDKIMVNMNELAFPATTNAEKLSQRILHSDKSCMTVVFATYHSIDVITKAQLNHGVGEFDLIICDEAHRTTGARLVDDDESNFVKVHDDKYVKGKKRLYMTATPRIYGESAKRKEEEGEVTLASMDNEEIYGETLFYQSFGKAVEDGLLTDFKVVVLMMDEQEVSDNIQKTFKEGSELKLDDATKIVGCYKALAKRGLKSFNGTNINQQPVRSALAFCQSIAYSKMVTEKFSEVVKDYMENEKSTNKSKIDLTVDLEHVDGTYNAEQRNEKISWLKGSTDEKTCRVLTNARCLSEGVDVPALDAILFMHPRKSQIDVVQIVGRVMRKAAGKDLGYVILPITVAPGVETNKALNDNKRFQVVWQILNALRTHDEGFDSTINRIRLGEDVSDKIEIINGTSGAELDATTAVVETIPKKSIQKGRDLDKVINDSGEDDDPRNNDPEDWQIPIDFAELSSAIMAKIVEKCGTRDYWENWASDIAKIAQQHIKRINSIVLNTGTPERKAFMQFVNDIRNDLNPKFSESDAVEMLAQHIITSPVFDSLFQDNHFTTENAVSKAMKTVLSKIYEHHIDTETRTLEKFYASVQRRAKDIITLNGRQTLIIELYDRFFRNAFPLMTQKLGIVYTPVEVVDFIVNSVEDVMKSSFDSSLGNEGVTILDPFTGTGTFVSRMMQSGILNKDQIRRKYKSEIFANEIVLLAYYVACINIESVYDDLIKENQYHPFDGMVLTDTFQLYEEERDMVADLLPDNSERRKKQKEQNITVIIGNPPYLVGQKSENQNAKRMDYPNLDQKIARTFAKKSLNKGGKRALYDSYIRAIRWALDRIDGKGVIGFVSGSAWIERNFADGMRSSIFEESDEIYIINLRGDIRKQRLSGGRAGQGDNVFGQNNQTGTAITIIVKGSTQTEKCIKYFDIGENLNQESKLLAIRSLNSIDGIEKIGKFEKIKPNENFDWINQRNPKFQSFSPLICKSKPSPDDIFNFTTYGVITSRDSWCVNFSRAQLEKNVESMVSFYNGEVKRFVESNWDGDIRNFVNSDQTKIKWGDSLLKDLQNGEFHQFQKQMIGLGAYRPFTKAYFYTDKNFIHSVCSMDTIFPKNNSVNQIISITGVGARSGFSTLCTDLISNYHFLDTAQNFPLFIPKIQNNNESQSEINFSNPELNSQSAINRKTVNKLREHYSDQSITDRDYFYFIYGLLHSLEYRSEFASNLSLEIPRIPLLANLDDFLEFSSKGKELSDLHVNYENVEKSLVTFKQGDLRLATIDDPKSFYRVEKMKFATHKSGKKDKSTIIYNKNLTIQNIPLEAYNYIVSGKSAIEWVMDRQCVRKDSKSKIENDANDYAIETVNNPAYPLELLQRVITVSLKTLEIVNSLPKLDIAE